MNFNEILRQKILRFSAILFNEGRCRYDVSENFADSSKIFASLLIGRFLGMNKKYVKINVLSNDLEKKINEFTQKMSSKCIEEIIDFNGIPHINDMYCGWTSEKLFNHMNGSMYNYEKSRCHIKLIKLLLSLFIYCQLLRKIKHLLSMVYSTNITLKICKYI